MNECVKTGFMFLNSAEGIVRTGDLFFFAGLWQIRGIPQAGFEMMDERYIDATVVNCVFAQRANSIYMDSNVGIQLTAPSKDFLKHIKEWYPYLMKQITVKAANDGSISGTDGGRSRRTDGETAEAGSVHGIAEVRSTES